MSQIKTRNFGRLPTGETVQEYTLANAGGLTLKLITFGGIITELHVPDRHGVVADVVLGFNHLAGYLGPHPHFGAITGRVAGRITGGRFSLAGRDYQLLVNNPPNHLHGGAVGFDKCLWRAQIVQTPEGFDGVKLAYHSPHGEEGYPGNVEVAVTYSLTDANEVIICYEAVADQTTPLSLTNHSYFNLAGEGRGTIENHWLQITSSEIVPTDEQMTLLGMRSPVALARTITNCPGPQWRVTWGAATTNRCTFGARVVDSSTAYAMTYTLGNRVLIVPYRNITAAALLARW